MKNEDNNTETTKANLELNKILEDSEVHDSIKGRSDSERANLQIQDVFNGDSKNKKDLPPTYLYNNTPAIKINKDTE